MVERNQLSAKVNCCFQKLIALSIISCIAVCALSFGCVNHNTIFEAARKGDLTDIKKHLQKDSQDLYAVTSDNHYSPLHIAALYGHLECVKYLVDAGISVNRRSLLMATPLHLAARGGNVEVVKYLIDKGAELNAISCEMSYGGTPYDEATKLGSFAAAELIQSRGGKSQIKN